MGCASSHPGPTRIAGPASASESSQIEIEFKNKHSDASHGSRRTISKDRTNCSRKSSKESVGNRKSSKSSNSTFSSRDSSSRDSKANGIEQRPSWNKGERQVGLPRYSVEVELTVTDVPSTTLEEAYVKCVEVTQACKRHVVMQWNHIEELLSARVALWSKLSGTLVSVAETLAFSGAVRRRDAAALLTPQLMNLAPEIFHAVEQVQEIENVYRNRQKLQAAVNKCSLKELELQLCKAEAAGIDTVADRVFQSILVYKQSSSKKPLPIRRCNSAPTIRKNSSKVNEPLKQVYPLRPPVDFIDATETTTTKECNDTDAIFLTWSSVTSDEACDVRDEGLCTVTEKEAKADERACKAQLPKRLPGRYVYTAPPRASVEDSTKEQLSIRGPSQGPRRQCLWKRQVQMQTARLSMLNRSDSSPGQATRAENLTVQSCQPSQKPKKDATAWSAVAEMLADEKRAQAIAGMHTRKPQVDLPPPESRAPLCVSAVGDAAPQRSATSPVQERKRQKRSRSCDGHDTQGSSKTTGERTGAKPTFEDGKRYRRAEQVPICSPGAEQALRGETVTPRCREDAIRVLGLPSKFTTADVRAAYMCAARHWHPDRPAWSSASEQQVRRAANEFQRAKAAYDLLGASRA